MQVLEQVAVAGGDGAGGEEEEAGFVVVAPVAEEGRAGYGVGGGCVIDFVVTFVLAGLCGLCGLLSLFCHGDQR